MRGVVALVAWATLGAARLIATVALRVAVALIAGGGRVAAIDSLDAVA
jgi:hypothetical protein